MEYNEKTEQSPTSRRAFVTSAMKAAAMATGVAMLAPKAAEARTYTYTDVPHPNSLNLPGGLRAGDDVHVLNYALLLEDLEADLYLQAIQRLTTGGMNKAGKSIPGLGISDSQPDVRYLKEFAPVEAEHRDFLRGSLNSLFSGLATPPGTYDFSIETKNREEVLALVLLAEETGVAAYLGAVPYLRTKYFVTAAASIQGTEARHTAIITAIQNRLFNGSSPKALAPSATQNNGRDGVLSPNEVLARVSPFIVRI